MSPTRTDQLPEPLRPHSPRPRRQHRPHTLHHHPSERPTKPISLQLSQHLNLIGPPHRLLSHTPDCNPTQPTTAHPRIIQPPSRDERNTMNAPRANQTPRAPIQHPGSARATRLRLALVARGVGRRVGVVCVVGVVVAGSAGLGAGWPGGTSVGAAEACRSRDAALVLSVSRGRWPGVAGHLARAQGPVGRDGLAERAPGSPVGGFSAVGRVDRAGAGARRARLLGWFEGRWPQPVGDGLDLDEEPPAVLRGSWRGSVLPVGEHENRSEGGWLGGQLSGWCEGQRVRLRVVR